jgi:hypothetical protein
LKGSFLTGLVFLPSLLAIADEVIKQSFRNASIDGGEVTSWVNLCPAPWPKARQLDP